MTSTAVYVFAPYRLLPAQRELLRADAPVKLGGRAFDVLVALVERRDRIVSKSELMDLVWPNVVVEENNLRCKWLRFASYSDHTRLPRFPDAAIASPPQSMPLLTRRCRRSRFGAAPTDEPLNDSLPRKSPPSLAGTRMSLNLRLK